MEEPGQVLPMACLVLRGRPFVALAHEISPDGLVPNLIAFNAGIEIRSRSPSAPS